MTPSSEKGESKMRVILSSLVAAVLLSGGIACPAAQADADGYLRCVHGGLGGYVDDAAAVAIGRDVIQLERANVPREAIANRLYSNGAMGFSLSETTTIVACAEHFLP
jgi:hypothetical protein